MPLRPIDDTIVAIATAPGEGGLAVLRVSGPEAFAIADRVFRGRRPLAACESHTLHHGWVVEAGGVRLDEVVAALFRAPRSYTRQDVVEISCHGGALSSRRILAAMLAAGARLAGPGEFTQRAFLSGRLDLAQAEAVADLIHAESGMAANFALCQLAGENSERLTMMSETLTDMLAQIEARIDFAEDVGGIEVPQALLSELRLQHILLQTWIQCGALGRALRAGVRVTLVGRPNAGKSSIFNALLGEDRAIVTPHPGTTRDRVSEVVEIDGLRVTLSDTAGLRKPSDEAEAAGIARSEAALGASSIVIWVLDGSRPLDDEDRQLSERLDTTRLLVVVNKADLAPRMTAEHVVGYFDRPVMVMGVSTVNGKGLTALRRAIGSFFGPAGGKMASMATNPRHADALDRARLAMVRAEEAGVSGMPGEIVALELREALGALGEVTGKTVGEDLLDRIFSSFCIGK